MYKLLSNKAASRTSSNADLSSLAGTLFVSSEQIVATQGRRTYICFIIVKAVCVGMTSVPLSAPTKIITPFFVASLTTLRKNLPQNNVCILLAIFRIGPLSEENHIGEAITILSHSSKNGYISCISSCIMHPLLLQQYLQSLQGEMSLKQDNILISPFKCFVNSSISAVVSPFFLGEPFIISVFICLLTSSNISKNLYYPLAALNYLCQQKYLKQKQPHLKKCLNLQSCKQGCPFSFQNAKSRSRFCF